MEELSQFEKLVSIRIMQEDAESIYSLLQSERDPIFAMEIIPYYALFVQSCQEFMGDNFLPETTASNIKDIRNHIKAYGQNYSKSKKRILYVDNKQDADFRSKLKFEYQKNWNIHLNLGTYWTQDYHIVGNTQQLADFLGVDNFSDTDAGQKQYELGYQIASFVSSIRKGFSESLIQPVVRRYKTSIEIKYYYDINTNRHNSLFLNNSSKELNLFFLHLLCNMNFVKYILRSLFIDGNTWVFRVEYIVTYYTFRALQRLKNFCENSSEVVTETKEIEEIISFGKNLFNSKFRNCMMHYNLENQGVLSLEHIKKPFFGIVETCFKGVEYHTYLHTLHKFSDKIIIYLENKFNSSKLQLQLL